MTHKNERQCWNCGSQDMENKGSHVQCKSCGTTWNEVPDMGGPTSESYLTPGHRETGYGPHSSGSPSPGVKRRVARARGELPPKRRPKQAAG